MLTVLLPIPAGLDMLAGMDARWGLRGPELSFYDAELIRPHSGVRVIAAEPGRVRRMGDDAARTAYLQSACGGDGEVTQVVEHERPPLRFGKLTTEREGSALAARGRAADPPLRELTAVRS